MPSRPLLAGLIVLAVGLTVGGCGSSTTSSAPSPVARVAVSGEVARSCVGPIFANRPRRCSDRAVFARGRTRVVVHGNFAVRLAPGIYTVSVDTCLDQQKLTVTRPIAGLMLAPRCPLPL